VPVIGNVLTYLSNDSREIDRDPAIQRNYWLLRTEVQTLIQNGSHKTILVTSPNRKEGKSTIVFRLALGLAQNQLKVLIVDADLRSPEQYKLFDLTVEHGLSDFLSGELKSLKPIILKDVRPGLDLLPNITESANPIALIQPPQWKSLIQLFDAYDVVIFDTPAFLEVPDTLDLARVVDGVIIVAQWGHTLRSDIQTVCGYLESINSKMIGMVVNQLPRSTAGSYYSNIALSYRQPEKTIPNSL
jgi:capsular exopolysaccharide synthesis family protein